MWTVFLLFFLAAWMGTPQAADAAAAIVLLSGNSDNRLVCLPLKPGSSFHLEFINSIYRAPVRETFVFEPGRGLFLVQVESPSAGVFEYYGLVPQRPGICSLRRRLGDIRILSSDYKHHRVCSGEKLVCLKGLVPDGKPVVLRIEEGEGCEHSRSSP